MCKPDVTSITVERSPKGGWDIYPWDRNGECDGGPAHATSIKKARAIAKALMCPQHPVQIHWVR